MPVTGGQLHLPLDEEFTLGVKRLHAAVTIFSYIDIAGRIDRHVARILEIIRVTALLAEDEQLLGISRGVGWPAKE